MIATAEYEESLKLLHTDDPGTLVQNIMREEKECIDTIQLNTMVKTGDNECNLETFIKNESPNLKTQMTQ